MVQLSSYVSVSQQNPRGRGPVVGTSGGVDPGQVSPLETTDYPKGVFPVTGESSFSRRALLAVPPPTYTSFRSPFGASLFPVLLLHSRTRLSDVVLGFLVVTLGSRGTFCTEVQCLYSSDHDKNN